MVLLWYLVQLQLWLSAKIRNKLKVEQTIFKHVLKLPMFITSHSDSPLFSWGVRIVRGPDVHKEWTW